MSEQRQTCWMLIIQKKLRRLTLCHLGATCSEAPPTRETHRALHRVINRFSTIYPMLIQCIFWRTEIERPMARTTPVVLVFAMQQNLTLAWLGELMIDKFGFALL